MSAFSRSQLASAGLLFALAAPAQAGNLPAAWVSGSGTDTPTCGAVATPCRTFQYVHDAILGPAGGDILVRDSGNYGALKIAKPLAVLNDGAGTAGTGAPANGVAITINAGPNDVITLRGLTLDGGGTAATGIEMDNGGSIEIQNSLIRNFTQMGISLTAPKFFYSITNATVSGIPSRGVGINILPSNRDGATQGLFRNVTVTNNGGVGVNAAFTDLSIMDSNISNNGAWGLQPSCGTNVVFVSNTTIAYNGIGINSGCGVVLTRTTIQQNQIGISAMNNGSFISYGDNNINFNTLKDIGGSASLIPVAKQ
jgi:hypothetical protein